MTLPNPEHLFEQAERLIAPPSSGPPRQTDLWRAISSAYYGVFHFTSAALADEFIGFTQRATSRYALVYRSIDHRTLREICTDIIKSTPPQKYVACLPTHGYGADLQAFASTAIELQSKRHVADYSPEPRFRTVDAQIAISAARSAVGHFTNTSHERRRAFLTLLLCPPR